MIIPRILILDHRKPVHEVVFSRKRSEAHHFLLMINNVPVKRVRFKKNLGLILDSKPDFNKHKHSVVQSY